LQDDVDDVHDKVKDISPTLIAALEAYGAPNKEDMKALMGKFSFMDQAISDVRLHVDRACGDADGPSFGPCSSASEPESKRMKKDNTVSDPVARARPKSHLDSSFDEEEEMSSCEVHAKKVQHRFRAFSGVSWPAGEAIYDDRLRNDLFGDEAEDS